MKLSTKFNRTLNQWKRTVESIEAGLMVSKEFKELAYANVGFYTELHKAAKKRGM